MTFDQFANQGGNAAWDPEAAAATKKAADKLFGEADDSIEVDDVVTPSETASARTDPDEDTPDHDSDQPGEVPDPDITLDP